MPDTYHITLKKKENLHMCVIIEKPAGVLLNPVNLKAAAERNEDGMGYMFIDPITGELVTHKQLFDKGKEGETFIEHFNNLKNVHAIFHLRWNTHGETSTENAHPFQILNKLEHGRDLYFMHNGMLSKMPTHETKSDTVMFNENYLRPILSQNPDLILQESFQEMVESFIGFNRLAFLDDLGRIVKLGDWKTKGDCFVSNNNYFDPPVAKKPEYTKPKEDKTLVGYTGNDNGNVEQLPLTDLTTKAEQRKWWLENGFDGWCDECGYTSEKDPCVCEDKEEESKDEETFTEYNLFYINNKLVKGEDIDSGDILYMDSEDMDDFVENNTERAALVIQDLVEEVFNLEYKYGYEGRGNTIH